MTKGKYAARAALRREDQGVQAEIEAYQHHVKRLTAENRELTGKLADEHAARTEEVRRLRVQLDEGLSLEMVALREELERQRQRAVQAEADQRKLRERRDREITALEGLFVEGLGLTRLEALELFLYLDPEEREDQFARSITDVGMRRSRKLDVHQARDIQAARGIRHRQGGRAYLVELLQFHLATAWAEKIQFVPCDADHCPWKAKAEGGDGTQ